VIQGGGFTVENNTVSAVQTRAPIANEFNPDNSNLRGTLSTALLQDDVNSNSKRNF